jgi:DeoR/GlpR family transcriptional regulator of sugar metabolism
VVVAADHSKWGVVGLASIAALSDIDVLVTDAGLSRSAQRVLTRSVGRLVLAAGSVPAEAVTG